MRTHKLLFLLLPALLCVSCIVNTAKKRKRYRDTRVKFYMDFGVVNDLYPEKGKWLLYPVNAPLPYRETFYQLVLSDFKKMLGPNLTEKRLSYGMLLPENLPMKPSHLQLADLYTGTNGMYDFIINIQVTEQSHDLPQIHILQHNGINQATVTLEIYDLKNATVLYSITSVGILQETGENDKLINSHETPEDIALGCYDYIIDYINDYNIKK